ncbi:hypothetical protein LINGRAPRIM_LOCUS2212 [Linum grandiflorum]
MHPSTAPELYSFSPNELDVVVSFLSSLPLSHFSSSSPPSSSPPSSFFSSPQWCPHPGRFASEFHQCSPLTNNRRSPVQNLALRRSATAVPSEHDDAVPGLLVFILSVGSATVNYTTLTMIMYPETLDATSESESMPKGERTTLCFFSESTIVFSYAFIMLAACAMKVEVFASLMFHLNML